MLKAFQVAPLSNELDDDIQHKIDFKTKPPGSLGGLESIAFQVARIQRTLAPKLERAQMLVFAADHGAVDKGISAFPQEVTPQMVTNFLAGGAAVSVFCKQHNVALKVVDVGVKVDMPDHPLLSKRKVAYASQDFSEQAALTLDEVNQALAAGAEEVDACQEVDLLLFGEMGIGNTGVSSCMMSAMTGQTPEQTSGRGTGLDELGVSKKAQIIAGALKRAEQALNKPMGEWAPWEVATQVGGLEILAMSGAMLRAAELSKPFVVDGFICTVALLFASKLQSAVTDYAIFAHQSDEQAHQALLQHFKAEPILKLNLRLGEGSGAILSYPIIKSAVVFFNEMASFESAGVTNAT
ncbi:nicotinate-nucleotide--dimethylbenzimidazole phosphoribosyltransferase [Marinomonas fungiae]|uniref:Nicotinate-nucleotide--dimethylbenzimidazole phosphoribosyltransferase n=1 Tax=Marinomonas fungiae TaxID=1137284 RepID=A0A0K6IHI2_9GAMM|nr:nicotinate-nucleotide--dimethylbenzimidazole phosphoribosyltransferase [Marinomonas fungiae]CUB02531.1 nicotinate-nucleotide-dimethylbenzimidazole phosphoribosyltransferase [Marinomonas fungiae]